MYYGMHYFIGIFWFMFVIKLLVIGLLVYVIYRFFKRSDIKSDFRTHVLERDRSLAILKERFARGEITEEEYSRMKELLMGDKK